MGDTVGLGPSIDATSPIRFRLAADGSLDGLSERWTEWTGRAVEAGSGQGWLDLVHPDDRAGVEGDVAIALRQGADLRRLLRLRHRDGAYRWLLAAATPHRASGGGPVRHWRGAFTDVEALVEASDRALDAAPIRGAVRATQDALARADRIATAGILSASIAHDLNQPLAALVLDAQTCLRWLRRTPPDLGEAIGVAERLARNSMRASEIVRTVRERLVNGSRRVVSIDVGRLLRDTLAVLERDLTDTAIRVEIDSPPDLPRLRADRIELQQVLVNLVTNALQALRGFEERPGLLQIAALARAPDLLRLRVRDNGPGVQADLLERIFDPFFTTKADGMGLGLAICRSTARALGGDLTAANHPDGGAVFDLTLPQDPAGASPA